MMSDDLPHAVNEQERIARSLQIIDEAIAKYKPARILGLFSGGHDSLTAVHVAARHPQFSYAVHINTGIGIPQTREFVRATALNQNWNLQEYKAADCGQDYAQIVSQYGFPGPAQHRTMYIRLKERPLNKAMKEAKSSYPRNTNILLISGVRFQESVRRMGYKDAVTKQGSKIWVNIINDWSKTDCNLYLQNHKIPRSPVVEKICKSGECLCGAFAKSGEFTELEYCFPEYAAHIKSLQSANGKRWGWGADRKTNGKEVGPLCAGCK